MEQQNNINKKENTKKENEENFNAFIKVLARLVQKYGPTVLEEIKKEEAEYCEARRLINMLKYFKTIPIEDVPTNSLLREFLGGGDFGDEVKKS